MLVTDDERLKEYLQGVANQLQELLRKKLIRQLVLVSRVELSWRHAGVLSISSNYL